MALTCFHYMHNLIHQVYFRMKPQTMLNRGKRGKKNKEQDPLLMGNVLAMLAVGKTDCQILPDQG